jgi:16S rRNA (guanine966-N2)-methyltransferase
LNSIGAVEGATVLDLFAGTGALGIEALSRGASHVTFVDRDPVATKTIRDNLESLGLGAGSADVVRADALRWLERAEAGISRRFELALCDPPYDFAGWQRLLAGLSANLVVIESSTPLEPPEGWTVRTVKRYGGTVVTLVQPLQQRVARKGAS